MEWFLSLRIKIIYHNGRFLQKFSHIFQSSFCNTFGRLLPWNQKPSRSSRPKVFLQLAVLKYLRKSPGNYPPWSTQAQSFSWNSSRIFLNSYLKFPCGCICGTKNHNTTVSPDTLRCSRPEAFLKSSALKNSREIPDQGISKTTFVTFGSSRPEV